MKDTIQHRDGIRLTLSNNTEIVFDGDAPSDVTVLSHAHGDHLLNNSARAVTSELTAALSNVRQSEQTLTTTTHPTVELFRAGHIAGSRAARVTDPQTGRTYLYTGDFTTRSRLYIEGFTPIEADVLITETTYGKPAYRFPPIAESLEQIHTWLEETMDTVVILFGYALGRAQKIQHILSHSSRSRVFITDAIDQLNETISSHRDLSFDARLYDADVELREGDALVLPMSTGRISWIESLVERTGAITAGFSGWAIDDSFIYQRGVDKGFVLSDHCDFDELVGLVESVDPEMVYTTHGFTETFAQYLTKHHGYDARALKQNQSTLTEF